MEHAVIANGLTGVSYIVIGLALIAAVMVGRGGGGARRREWAAHLTAVVAGHMPALYALYGTFIFLCGLHHIGETGLFGSAAVDWAMAGVSAVAAAP